ncbi:hypothetical protein BCR35DRAFT_289209 [Leucosporidium creatinivorum]|uniref:Cytochrome b561 domain-containing protein n=1 Tax=Leucosporidium creatinivorum TaxID=106004 RepID=A0A1Y2FXR1_9BASI|nr:hypothetical protein BCR35DRAFT_289209 [Leucosporidium creatinivorum]
MLPFSRPLAYCGAALLTLSFASSGQAQTLSNQQIASVFGEGATDLTGSSVKLPQFTFAIITNATHALYSLNSSSQSFQVGWMGVGSGTAMANADFLISWPNPDGINGPAATPWTISHRSSTGGEAQPVVASTASATSTASFYTFLPELSTNSSASYTAVSFLRLLEAPSNYPSTSSFKSLNRNGPNSFIYASSTVQPGSSEEGAVITQHNQASPIPRQQKWRSVTNAFHATGALDDLARLEQAPVCASLALVLFAPIAVLLARFLRGSTWYPSHAALNALAGILVLVAFALGVHSVRGEHFDGTHQRLGLIIFILVMLQILLGAFAHSRPVQPSPAGRLPTLSKKSPFRLFHIVLGVAILALGWVNVHEGFEQWEKSSDAQTEVPMGAKIVFYILIALFAAAYVAGWVLEAMGSNRPSKTDDGQKHAEKIGSHTSP